MENNELFGFAHFVLWLIASCGIFVILAQICLALAPTGMPRHTRPFPDRPHPRPTTPVPPYNPPRDAKPLPIFQGSPPEVTS